MVVPAYPGRVVLRKIYNQFYRVISFNAFWKFERLRNSAWYFLGGAGRGGGNFWSRNFLAFNGPRNFLGFDFCSHSVIPETRSTPPRLGSHFPSMESSKEKSLRHIAMVAKFLGMTTNRKRPT